MKRRGRREGGDRKKEGVFFFFQKCFIVREVVFLFIFKGETTKCGLYKCGLRQIRTNSPHCRIMHIVVSPFC